MSTWKAEGYNMKLSTDDEQTWMHKGWQAFTEVNFVKNTMMYFVVSPEGTPRYLGANLDKKVVNNFIEKQDSYLNSL
jgi:hypothetical protein